MAKKLSDFQTDSRIVNLNFRRGNLTKGEYETFITTLPDLSKQAEELKIQSEETTEESDVLTFSVV